SSDWKSIPAADLDWKEIVEPVMKLYTEATDGSNIETKDSAVVWHHQDADPDFGSCQAKELLDHLENSTIDRLGAFVLRFAFLLFIDLGPAARNNIFQDENSDTAFTWKRKEEQEEEEDDAEQLLLELNNL
ncbi:hypothetical protein RJ640_027914, partial [Escallonia rubra]